MTTTPHRAEPLIHVSIELLLTRGECDWLKRYGPRHGARGMTVERAVKGIVLRAIHEQMAKQMAADEREGTRSASRRG